MKSRYIIVSNNISRLFIKLIFCIIEYNRILVKVKIKKIKKSRLYTKIQI